MAELCKTLACSRHTFRNSARSREYHERSHSGVQGICDAMNEHSLCQAVQTDKPTKFLTKFRIPGVNSEWEAGPVWIGENWLQRQVPCGSPSKESCYVGILQGEACFSQALKYAGTLLAWRSLCFWKRQVPRSEEAFPLWKTSQEVLSSTVGTHCFYLCVIKWYRVCVWHLLLKSPTSKSVQFIMCWWYSDTHLGR